MKSSISLPPQEREGVYAVTVTDEHITASSFVRVQLWPQAGSAADGPVIAAWAVQRKADSPGTFTLLYACSGPLPEAWVAGYEIIN